MTEIGEPAPDFEVPSSLGHPVRLSAWRGHPVILFFFPKANTAGCRRETKGFADLFPRLEAQGVQIVGVSVDDVGTQSGFAEVCRAEFPIAADADRRVAKAYGVLGFLGYARRVTFFVGPDGVVLDKVASALPGPHLERARERYLSAR